jgi:putative endonuclease
MAAVYILISAKLDKYYVGSCLDLKQRLLDHKDQIYQDSFTALTNDWELYFEMSALDGVVARKIEKHIKAMKSKRYIQNLKKYPEMRSKLLSRFSEVK